MCRQCDIRLEINTNTAKNALDEIQLDLIMLLHCLAGLHGRSVPAPFSSDPDWIYHLLFLTRARLYRVHKNLASIYGRYINYEAINANITRENTVGLKLTGLLEMRRTIACQIEDYRRELTNRVKFDAVMFYADEGKILKLIMPEDEHHLFVIYREYGFLPMPCMQLATA